jgi:hypothetical protein
MCPPAEMRDVSEQAILLIIDAGGNVDGLNDSAR